MRIRVDSPFHGIPGDVKQYLLDMADMGMSNLEISEEYMKEMEVCGVSANQLKRFLTRLTFDEALRNTDDSPEGMEGFVERAKDGKARDGMIEASREKLFEEALAEGDKALLLELYKAANEERARERELAVAQRKAAVAEENAKIGWRRLEWQKAQSAVRLLPKIREVLMEGAGSAEEKKEAAKASDGERYQEIAARLLNDPEVKDRLIDQAVAGLRGRAYKRKLGT